MEDGVSNVHTPYFTGKRDYVGEHAQIGGRKYEKGS
jgi:hypothetical protein